MSLLDVAGTAQKLLDLVVDVASAEDVELPERRYVTAGVSGAEVWDCEQVVVGLSNLIPGNAARPATLLGESTLTAPGALMLFSAVLRVEIVRCIPVISDNGQAPKTPAEHSAGLASMRDAALLHAVRVKATRDAALTGGEPGDVLPGNITPAGPEGGFAGVAMTMTVTVGALEAT